MNGLCHSNRTAHIDNTAAASELLILFACSTDD